ncbi:MAG: hypothetical protein JSS56_06025 [Proteobacteria bacterium]|nr:hypothetical protein [Pseudomonadota bacterium]
MNSEQHLVLHGLAIKKYALPGAIASLLGLPEERVKAVLTEGVAKGTVIDVGGKFSVSPTARVSLHSNYGRFYPSLRASKEFRDAHLAFEKVNIDLKTLITDWQTLKIGGKLVPNDHSDEAYDEQILKRLAKLHSNAEKVLTALAKVLPRIGIYLDKLEEALEKAESGEIEWVSDAKIESYHTVWFELHEDLLCLLGEQRKE